MSKKTIDEQTENVLWLFYQTAPKLVAEEIWNNWSYLAPISDYPRPPLELFIALWRKFELDEDKNQDDLMV